MKRILMYSVTMKFSVISAVVIIGKQNTVLVYLPRFPVLHI